LGVFELRLPTFLLNVTSSQEGRGGYLGVVFMALTLTITSFTCTFPVVGTLLVSAARGQYFYPILGMLVFSTVLAMPFFALALAPGLLSKVPKSGDWMNAIKVVGGLVEIGAAFKFLNTAEIGFGVTPSRAFFDAQFVLAAWVVLALVCGLYLLGIFRTDHDHGDGRIGAGRMLSGALFLGLAIYLAPALFGYPPKGRIYESIVGILPQDAGELDSTEHTVQETVARLQLLLPEAGTRSVADAGSNGRGGGSAATNAFARTVKATSPEPATAEREEIEALHGIGWGFSYDAALERAKAENRPILIDFTGVNCANCRTMEKAVLPKSEVAEQIRKFVPVRLYTDRVPIESITADEREDLAIANLTREVELTSENTQPLYVVIDPQGRVIGKQSFVSDPAEFVAFLKSSLTKAGAVALESGAGPRTASGGD
jgi:thiol:disulfide interchange protein DsbD